MLRFLIFFILITASFAGGLMLAIHYKGRGMEDTPYIADFRKRYEINPEYPFAIMYYMGKGCKKSSYRNPCTKKDIEVLKAQAKNGDLFASCSYPIAALNYGVMNTDKLHKNTLESAIMGESNCILYAAFYPTSMESEVNSIMELSASKGSISSALRLISKYNKANDNVNFCRVLNDTYKKHGIEAISIYLYRDDYGDLSNRYFTNCTNIKKEELLSLDTADVKLINGYKAYIEKDYKQAANFFLQLADLDNKIGYNATQCLGVMHYKGNGVDKDEKKGIEMIKESFEKGVLCEVPWVQLMPETYQYNNYGGVSSICCLDITPKRLGGNL